jgi:hypothetical protein
VLHLGGHPQPLKHLDTGASGHIDIEHNQPRNGTQLGHGKDCLEALRVQERGQQFSLEARVVGDQNVMHEETGPDEIQPSGAFISTNGDLRLDGESTLVRVPATIP